MNRKHLANAIRALSMDSIQRANSGHPGAPMGMANIAEVLWRSHLKHNPANPMWINRDRFILSNGHGSMLVYSLLHLTGYALTLDDLKNFRQLHSKTPGHPEYGCVGIETTTGPLGQGIANAVGIALAEKNLAAQFNKEGYNIVDHFTYVFIGDGCLMEGISHEACSLAGTLGLSKLIVFWDDNGISIDGKVKNWFSDDTPKRFEAYGWHVISTIDGHDPEIINNAIKAAKAEIIRPTLICAKTIIGFGSPNKAGSSHCHGSPLGVKEIAAVRKKLDWQYAPFEIPSEIYAEWNFKKMGAAYEKEWNDKFTSYEIEYPNLSLEFKRRIKGQLPINWEERTNRIIANFQANPKNVSSRQASQNMIEEFGEILPEFIGGSADLSPSNLTMWSGSKAISFDDASGNYIHYGVREFGMTAVINGIALHGGFIPYGATFLVFMEYACNAMRMAALMKIQNIQVYTHDSIGLGEDGPTHQPIEQIASLRLTPNMSTWRPCDQVESAVAWKLAIERKDGPTSLILSRQNLVQQERTSEQISNIAMGGYILKDCIGEPELILIATGSEIQIAIEAAMQLNSEGKKIRVVSMPATDVFDKQNLEYREAVLPSKITARIAIEASIADFWYKYVGFDGRVIGMSTFGTSAPASDLFKIFGFTSKNVINVAKEMLA
ncbi:transketolase 2 [Candidatus Photodesmus blepharus]|uniref:Transketolase n=1 Tax=Candidatus Photodesmus blepharonis TaxID=1179155 RepID=A0A084CM97_9GAMM|nr:transketolase [Candidatus Photodesmus blepharus]KEY90926.1 transketolase 2 [Candidatus Photodesmus blepharus]